MLLEKNIEISEGNEIHRFPEGPVSREFVCSIMCFLQVKLFTSAVCIPLHKQLCLKY